MAQIAGHALLTIDHHGAGDGIPPDGLNGADIRAVCIGALVADRGKMIEILTGVFDLEQCPMGIVATQQAHAAGQLAKAAAGAQVKIGFDEKLVGHRQSGCSTHVDSAR
jgi:hypothetical protein